MLAIDSLLWGAWPERVGDRRLAIDTGSHEELTHLVLATETRKRVKDIAVSARDISWSMSKRSLILGSESHHHVASLLSRVAPQMLSLVVGPLVRGWGRWNGPSPCAACLPSQRSSTNSADTVVIGFRAQ